MSLLRRFPTAFHPPRDNDFRSLFRLMDDITSSYENSVPNTTSVRAFSPRFDVEEKESAYHLHGELPGIDQKDIEIEFTDPHTLIIKGSTESHNERWENPNKIENGDTPKQITKGDHQPTVQDENAPQQSDSQGTGVVSAEPEKKAVAQAGKSSGSKWWVSERSMGEFYRSFTFPSRVDQDGVKASLNRGILSIEVPKLAQKKGSRKINIENVE